MTQGALLLNAVLAFVERKKMPLKDSIWPVLLSKKHGKALKDRSKFFI
jgi:hypothetical protein